MHIDTHLDDALAASLDAATQALRSKTNITVLPRQTYDDILEVLRELEQWREAIVTRKYAPGVLSFHELLDKAHAALVKAEGSAT